MSCESYQTDDGDTRHLKHDDIEFFGIPPCFAQDLLRTAKIHTRLASKALREPTVIRTFFHDVRNVVL